MLEPVLYRLARMMEDTSGTGYAVGLVVIVALSPVGMTQTHVQGLIYGQFGLMCTILTIRMSFYLLYLNRTMNSYCGGIANKEICLNSPFPT